MFVTFFLLTLCIIPIISCISLILMHHQIKFNLSTAENPKNLEIGSDLRTEIIENLKACLKKNEKAFAWGYEDMPGIDRSIAQHFIPTDPDKKPVKQKRRRIRTE